MDQRLLLSMSLIKLIVNPDEFFRGLKEKDVSLKKPALIVLLLSITTAYYQFRLMTKISAALPADVAKFFAVGAYISVAGTVLGMFAVWLVVAVIIYGLSAFFDGEGVFRRTFEFTGYGFLPSLLGSAVTVPFSLSYLDTISVPKMSVKEFAANPEILAKAILEQIPREYVYSALLLNLAVTTWSLLIWSFAVKNARGIEAKKACLCALIPTVVFGGYQIVSLTRLI